MATLILILFSPFWAATGFYPKRLLAEKPRFSFWVYSAAFLFCSLWHRVFLDPSHDKIYLRIVQVVLGYFLILIFFRPKWQVAILMAWVGTDLIFLFTGFHHPAIDWILFIVYYVRESIELNQLKRKS